MKSNRTFFQGILQISIEGEQLERFFNLCKNHQIYLEYITLESTHRALVQINAADFYRLIPLRRKTNVHIHICQKYGLPFFFFKYRKRKAFFLGILLAIVLFFYFTCRIWNIEIYGNSQISTKDILIFLESEGIVHGIQKNKIDCSSIAKRVRESFSEATWVSVKQKGTKLILDLQEDSTIKHVFPVDEPCNLSAEKSGLIIDMITRTGIPSVKIGEHCKSGDLLISGCIEILNDNKEITGYDYVHADGDVFIKYKLPYYREIPLNHKTKRNSENSYDRYFFQCKNFYIEFGTSPHKEIYKTITYHPVKLTSNFLLPVSFGKITEMAYHITHATYSPQEALELSWVNLQKYEENLLEKGVQISSNNVKIEVNDQICISRGYLEVIEKIGIETPLEKKESLTIERNATNG